MEFDTLFMHCFGSFLLQAMFLSLQVFAFVEFLYSKSLQTSFIALTASRVRVASVIPSAFTDLQY